MTCHCFHRFPPVIGLRSLSASIFGERKPSGRFEESERCVYTKITDLGQLNDGRFRKIPCQV